MKKMLVIAALAAGAALALDKGRSSAPETGADLPDATVARSIPLYPGAAYVDMSSGGYSGSNDRFSRYTAWELRVTDPRSRVVAFYERALPRAERDANEDEATFTVRPEGVAGRVDVRVFDGRLEIWEYR